ncbi:MAG TPA: GNAT family N-acetyltransferase, partial [Thermotogota bacterium]|nr:GNAT family N-acetyltransferase [Thermotogota bacterium]
NSKALGFENYLLEVIQTNTKAYELYLDKGFEVVRSFDVYRCDVEKLRFPEIKNTAEVEVIQNEDWELFKTFWDITPSWQNSIESIKRVRETFEIFAAFDKGNCIGYLIVETATGDIPQIAVHKDYRQQNIATSLIKKASENRRQGYRLSFLNINSDYSPYCDFLKKLGAELIVKQYEMIKSLH